MRLMNVYIFNKTNKTTTITTHSFILIYMFICLFKTISNLLSYYIICRLSLYQIYTINLLNDGMTSIYFAFLSLVFSVNRAESPASSSASFIIKPIIQTPHPQTTQALALALTLNYHYTTTTTTSLYVHIETPKGKRTDLRRKYCDPITKQ
ncbi:hypothetical protein PPL_02071 [Heterostelium album PN500]|uniref:Uncharacterized protein n=1 Tax=Heterostelium pallidum (strain ATCC 26659 / Pp 5 / PN500) TaxID=670386 RepID=D3B1A0_HETP5|nr:hypothetical protein PPL_02071 [Heterostelium album PN500]EFA85074.1 hypothetical protein PPL_02071 [Heterostelium album PN500]|eukprot:XP_020437184.1 hypothetical protein PPL_02071 [Heterostelium album PN500]